MVCLPFLSLGLLIWLYIVQTKFNSATWTLDKVEIDTKLNKDLSKKEDSTNKLKAITLEHIKTEYPDHKKITKNRMQ